VRIDRDVTLPLLPSFGQSTPSIAVHGKLPSDVSLRARTRTVWAGSTCACQKPVQRDRLLFRRCSRATQSGRPDTG
jgi:hypothetical protein